MIARWFYLPSLLFLLLALLSGTWLRLQWGWPQWQVLGLDLPWSLFLRVEYLLHGHSHVALLGWTFLALAGLILEAGTRRNRLPVRSLRVLAALTILVTIFLFIAFVRDGYAPLSIALSTIHMLLGYVLVWIFFRHARTDSNTGSRYFLEGAVFWMVMATAGPWLLAAGRGLSPFWMDAAVQYYLHVLFNGWLLFGLAGLAFRYLLHSRFRQMTWPFWLMMAGLLPALLPQLGPQSPEMLSLPVGVTTAAGLTGSILFAAGGLAVVWFTFMSLRERKKSGEGKAENRIGESLLYIGLGASVPVLLLPAFMAWPPVHALWSQSDFLTIGFIHLHLLAVVSTLLLYGIIQRVAPVFAIGFGRNTADVDDRKAADTDSRNAVDTGGRGVADERSVAGRRPLTSLFTTGQYPQALEKRARRFRLLLRFGIALFVSGSLAMVILLIVTGLFQLAGSLPPYPVQKTLFYTGLMTLTGAIPVATALFFRPSK